MKHILAASHARLLSELAAGDALLAFDYDGTLAPIVPDPSQAFMRPATRRLFGKVASRYPCAVISGRSRESVSGLLDGVEVRYVIGNHGAEWPGETSVMERYEQLVRAWRPALEQALAHVSGVVLEDKRYSLAVHYREAPDPRAAARAIHAATRRLEQVRAVDGILVVNLVPAHAENKGGALRRLRAETGCARALFIGDDVTDEDVFRLRASWLLGVRVGRSRDSRAGFFVRDQREVDSLLRALYNLRARFPTRGLQLHEEQRSGH